MDTAIPVHTKGFTLLELTIAVAVLGLIAALGLAGLSSFRDSSVLSKTADDAATLLRTARSRTLSSLNQSSYGVYFGTSTIVLFRGLQYSADDPSNEVVALSPRIEVSASTLIASSTAFRRLSGEATSAGSVTFRLTQTPAKTKIITIYGSGLFTIQ